MIIINNDRFDTDGSGQIEFPEFCNMMARKILLNFLLETCLFINLLIILIYGSKMSDNDDEEAVRWAMILNKNIYQISFGSFKKFSSVLAKNRAFVPFFVLIYNEDFNILKSS